MSTPPPPTSSQRSETSAIGLAFVFELIQVLAISLAIIIPVRYFLIQPFYVKGASMEPNFLDHEYLIINEVGYRFEEPKRGDVVVFKYAREGLGQQYLIKRVIGLPGETVKIGDGTIRIFNTEHPAGLVLDEVYLSEENHYTGSIREQKLGPGEYYVLGDNRLVSKDSRVFGPIRKEDIVGKAWIRGWPVDRWGVLSGAEY